MQEKPEDENAVGTNEGRQYATFVVDDMFFGIEVTHVQEVLRFQETTPVPRAPKVINGLINLRGQIVTAIDLRRRLGLTERDKDSLPMNVVLRTDDEVVSLLVDEIGDVIELSSEDFEDPPETISDVARETIVSVCKLQDRLLLALAPEKVLQIN